MLTARDFKAQIKLGARLQAGTLARRMQQASSSLVSLAGLPLDPWHKNTLAHTKGLAKALYGFESAPAPKASIQNLRSA
eukprot:7333018-Alexandrium_andersonii.AAC.1